MAETRETNTVARTTWTYSSVGPPSQTPQGGCVPDINVRVGPCVVVTCPK